MTRSDDALLEANGWTLECESPLEIRHDISGSFASGLAARLVLDHLRELQREDEVPSPGETQPGAPQ